MRIATCLIALVALVTPQVTHGQIRDAFDDAGNLPATATPAERTEVPAQNGPRALGDVLNSFPQPLLGFDLTFRGGTLWMSNRGNGLVEMDPDTGAQLSTLIIAPPTSFSAGVGYDTTRGLFVVTDAAPDTVVTVDPTTGAVQSTFPSPGAGPVGASYDSSRDGYWIADFMADTLWLMDATTGATLGSCPVAGLGASRIAGVAYAPATDRLVFNSRDNATTYIINAGDCSLEASFATPPAPGLNNGSGVTIRPSDFTIYVAAYDVATIYVVDSGGLLPVELQSLSVD